jgi:hypothetical protein
LNNQLPVYAFPLDKRNVIGKLGFQLLLTGPAEEVVYRALQFFDGRRRVFVYRTVFLK